MGRYLRGCSLGLAWCWWVVVRYDARVGKYGDGMSLGKSTRRWRALFLKCQHCVCCALCWCTFTVYTVKNVRVIADAYCNWSPAAGPRVAVLTWTENTDSRSDHRRSVVWQPVSREDCPRIAESGADSKGAPDNRRWPSAALGVTGALQNVIQCMESTLNASIAYIRYLWPLTILNRSTDSKAQNLRHRRECTTQLRALVPADHLRG